MVELTPGPIILRKGRKAKDVFLIVTGTVEKIRSENDVYNVLSAGGLIGEYSGLHDVTSSLAYRTVSCVRALQLTHNSYFGFIQKNGLEADINRLFENREALEQTWLFGEEQILHGKPQECELQTTGPCEVYEVPRSKIVSIPIVMRKLLETHELRLAAQAGAFVRSTLPALGKTGKSPIKSNRKAQPSAETVASA